MRRRFNLLILITILISVESYGQLKIHKVKCTDGLYVGTNITNKGDTTFFLPNQPEDGHWIIYYDLEKEQKTYECIIEGGLWEGKDEYFFRNGKKKFEGNFQNGKREGSYSEWYEYGQKKVEAKFKAGMRDSLYREWYADGKLMFEGVYHEGWGRDIHTEWYEDGVKRSAWNYNSNGYLDSTSTIWNKNGVIEFLRDYKNGELTFIKRFYNDGSKMMEIDVLKHPEGIEGGDFWDKKGKKIAFSEWQTYMKENSGE